MRPWLVGIGTALVVVGVGTFALLLSLPPTTLTTIHTFQGEVGAHTFNGFPLWMENTSLGSLELNWTSVQPLTFALYHPTLCSRFPACPLGTPVMTWTSMVSGYWSTSGSLSFPYLLNITNTAGAPASFLAAFTESFTVHTGPIPPVTELFVYTGGAILTVIGALAVFLGLFLRGGVYRGPPRVVSRSADDLEDLYPENLPPDDDVVR
ncbi:MAG: hypothetical protein WAN87_10310 [Thermoplasmata archaeon]